jgi:site-specific DNA-methyltransferase (adenine-specific)
MNTALMFSKASDEWETPQDFFYELHCEFGFTLDVCATEQNRKCQLFYSQEDDGLSQDWSASSANPVCWMNPPYSQLKLWLQKASAQAQLGATTVCLIPSRTDTKAWHSFVWDENEHRLRPGVEIRFVKGRLKFGGCTNSAPFPSAVVIFRPRLEAKP